MSAFMLEGMWSQVQSFHSRLGMCLSRCSLRVKLFPQYAQKTMVNEGMETIESMVV